MNISTNNLTKFQIKDREFIFNHPVLMGILNVTPDSFSDGGKYFNTEEAVKSALLMIDQGVDIIDIGGESSRPGSDPVSVDEELARVVPVIEKLLYLRPDAILSVDTYKSRVAKEVLDMGVDIINDISGGRLDPEIILTAAKYDATFVIMHSKSVPKDMQQFTDYNDVIAEIKDFFIERIETSRQSGIKNIFLDPGIGFAKSVEQNYRIINKLHEFSSLGFPLLVGLSRKSFIGQTIEPDIEKRDFPSAILETIAILNGAKIIRTHNIANFLTVKKIFSNL